MTGIIPYLRCSFEVNPVAPWSDLLIADLGQEGFEAFEENETGFAAYIQEPQFNEEKLKPVLAAYEDQCKVAYQTSRIEPVNWNEKWEQEFEPVFVEDRCAIVAPFHRLEKSFPYTVVLNPKMAFGTGHHQTTYLMAGRLLDLDLSGRTVLDMGCGTGVLAILAALKGAGKVYAIDNDEWAYQNCQENVLLNDAKQIIVEKGDGSCLKGRSFNVIFANINKNVLLDDIALYAECLPEGGQLLLSGFFEEDIKDIDAAADRHSLKKTGFNVLRNWAMVHYVK